MQFIFVCSVLFLCAALAGFVGQEGVFDTFQVSKKVFKKAVGDLYKRRIITITDDGIKLTE